VTAMSWNGGRTGREAYNNMKSEKHAGGSTRSSSESIPLPYRGSVKGGESGEQFALRGSMTALVTPFHDHEVDWEAVDRLVDRQVEAETDWLVPCGTTGESPTLTEPELDGLIERVVTRAAGRRPVMAGTGSYCTEKSVERTRRAAALGVEAGLVVTPYYNRPTQEGLFRHFAAVARSVDLPIVLYNVPVRTGVNLSNDVIVRLRSEFPNIVGVKDATGSLDSVTDLLSRCDIAVLCGDDALTLPMMALGAVGVISVLGNLDPGLMHALTSASLNDEWEAARSHHRRVHTLAASLGRFGPNPIPIKTAMSIQGWIQEEFRLPLCPMDRAAREDLAKLVRRHGIQETVAA